MASGEGCVCAAGCEGDCCCDVEWRTEEEIFYKHKSEHLENILEVIKIHSANPYNNDARILIKIRRSLRMVEDKYSFGKGVV